MGAQSGATFGCESSEKGPEGAAPREGVIAEAIESLIGARASDATVCPSEVARLLAGDDGPWRSLMPDVREVAAQLAKEGRICVTRSGTEVDATSAGGPIRLGRSRR